MNAARKINLVRQRKPSALGKLDVLTPEQRQTVKGWLVKDNLTYEQAGKRIAAQFGIQASKDVLCAFYQKHCQAVTLPSIKPQPGTGQVVAEVVIQVRLPRQ